MNAQEKIDQLMKAEMEHIRSVGGILNLPEADSVLNDLNREKLKALKELHGHLYLGRINIHDTAQRLRVVEGTEDVYEEMLDQPLYNFCCDFAVPVNSRHEGRAENHRACRAARRREFDLDLNKI